MKYWKYLRKAAGLFVALSAMCATPTACNDNDNPYNTTDGADPRLTVHNGVSSLVLERTPLDTFLTLNCNVAWKIVSSQEWCTVTPSVGRVNIGGMKVKVSVTENTTIDARTADLNFIAGDLVATVGITQWGVAPTLAVSGAGGTGYNVATNESQVPAAETEASYVVSANQPWSASVVDAGSGTDWLTITSGASSTATSTTLTARIAANASLTAARSADIIITGSKNKDTIRVIQAHDEPWLTATPDAIEVVAEGGTVDVTIASNVAWTHSITGGGGWCAVSGSPGTLTTFTVAPNTGDARSATVTFTAAGYPAVTARLVISQLEAGVSVVPPTVTTVNDSSARVEITGANLDIVTAVDFGGTQAPASDFKKQSPSQLWVLAPVAIAAGTQVDVKLIYSAGDVPVKTGFTVTDFYTIIIHPTGRNNGGTNQGSPVISFTKEPHVFTVCEAETDKLNMDVLLSAKNSNALMTLFSLNGSTGTTNNFTCTATGIAVGGWAEKNLIALRSAEYPADNYNTLTNITTSGSFPTSANNELVIRDDASGINITGTARSIVTRFGTAFQRRVLIKPLDLTFGANAADGFAIFEVKIQRLAAD